jgi:Xaa-Pro aminopeptidase
MVSRLHPHTQNLQKLLGRLHVDGYWVSHAPDLFYLSGFGAEGCWGLIGRLPAGRQAAQAAMLVPVLAAEQAAAAAKGFTIHPLKKVSEGYGNAVEFVAKAGWKSVGYDPYRTPEAHIRGMRRASGRRIRWVASPGAMGQLRVIKDQVEIRALRRAGHLAVRGFAYLRKNARPGMRECDLAAEFEWFIRKHGATKAAFDSIVASGENASYPHYITGSRILRKNDVVLCDLGAQVDGYCSDLTRTFFLGRISPLGRKMFETVARAQRGAIEAVKPGLKAAQIDRVARDEIERAGYGRRFIHSTGHGVGVEVHEAPWVGPTSREILAPGMIITVEPGIYLQGWGGVRIEDTLLVTRSGCEILTK